MKTAETSYDQQATDLLKKLGVSFSVKYLDHDFYFDDDKEKRDIYSVTFRRGNKRFSLKFGQSIANQGAPPTAYDVLACIQKYDPGTFENFCSEFGYDTDSRKAEKIYKAVCKEWQKVSTFFTSNEIEELQEIN